MKNYIALLLSCTFICTQAMMEEDVPTINIPVLNKNGKKIGSEQILLMLTSTLSWYDIQDMLREKLGPGNIAVGYFKVPIGERIEQIPLYNQSLSAHLKMLEQFPSLKKDWDQANYRFILNQQSIDHT
jgi:hypothetical protein